MMKDRFLFYMNAEDLGPPRFAIGGFQTFSGRVAAVPCFFFSRNSLTPFCSVHPAGQ